MGFLAADAFVRRFGGIIQRKRTRSTDKTELIYNDRHIVVIKPLLYMNRSGDALISIRAQLLSPDNRVLVIYDDTTLPFGALRFRRKGSSGGKRWWSISRAASRKGTSGWSSAIGQRR
jgi:PTH1 family peptidyl-tRNA hydrolase